MIRCPRFLPCLALVTLRWLGGPATAAPPVVPVVPEKADIARYRVLWEQPLFAVAAEPTPAEPEVAEVPAESADLRLAGWGEVGGVETAVVFNRTTLETFVLDASDNASVAGMQLLQLERGSDGEGPEALVAWQGRTFWIRSRDPGEEAAVPAPALEVDSRSARLKAPVLLGKEDTMEDWLGTRNQGEGGQSSRMQELRERHRRLQERFSR
jgi:hypothetical protein